MALTMTLADSLQLTQDTLQAGVIETLATESKILAVLPFMNIQGSGYTYNVEKTLSDTKFRAVGEAITPGHADWETRTEALKILGDEAVIDTFQVATYGNKVDLMALEVQLKAKAVGHTFEKTFIKGNSSTNIKEFDGIEKRVVASQKVGFKGIKETVGGAEVAGYARALDVLGDKILGTPSAYIMNKKTRREIVANFRKYIEFHENAFGKQLAYYNGVPILDVENEIIADEGVIYAVKFAAKEGVCGLQNGSVQVKSLGEVDNAPQMKTRIEWFVGLAVFNDRALAKADKAAADTGKDFVAVAP